MHLYEVTPNNGGRAHAVEYIHKIRQITRTLFLVTFVDNGQDIAMHRSTDNKARCVMDERQNEKFPKAFTFPQRCPYRHFPATTLPMAHGITSKPTNRSATANEITASLLAIDFSALIFASVPITKAFPIIVVTSTMIMTTAVKITALAGHVEVTKVKSSFVQSSAEERLVRSLDISRYSRCLNQ